MQHLPNKYLCNLWTIGALSRPSPATVAVNPRAAAGSQNLAAALSQDWLCDACLASGERRTDARRLRRTTVRPIR